MEQRGTPISNQEIGRVTYAFVLLYSDYPGDLIRSTQHVYTVECTEEEAASLAAELSERLGDHFAGGDCAYEIEFERVAPCLPDDLQQVVSDIVGDAEESEGDCGD